MTTEVAEKLPLPLGEGESTETANGERVMIEEATLLLTDVVREAAHPLVGEIGRLGI